LLTPTGERATGEGIAVALIDTGFAHHPYFADHGYRIKRLATPDASAPSDDLGPHGTAILANLLACAPDVKAYAIKHGEDTALAIGFAVALKPKPAVISISWADDLVGLTKLPDELLSERMAILDAVAGDVTVVAAGGNGQIAFPGMLPEVISVGGVAVAEDDGLSQWPLASSFTSSIYKGRKVPDISGIASEMFRPIPGDGSGPLFDWDDGAGGTSSATPQVAGICALLLQKNSSLTPPQVRSALRRSAKPVAPGTGKGLVNAHKAWNRV
jgi:subtilisin family serine protease